MAGHLPELLSDSLLGVNNGPFVDMDIDVKALQSAANGDYQAMTKWKADKRSQALKALGNLIPSEEEPVWGDLKKFDRDDDACWFVMAGRDDSRQKGYDTAASSIQRFLGAGGDARFFFFPIPGDEGRAGLGFLKRLAEQFPESVLVFPFRWQDGFMATLQGSAFGVMPSLYEPFGMVSEFYLKGTLGIGRASGGIIQQIVPLGSASCYSRAAHTRAAEWHGASAAPTGILFRERDGIRTAVDDWKMINKAAYDINYPDNDRVNQREQFNLFRAMADEL
jgi:glycosyltransferase involved in cell wall biosynthesis